MKKFLKKLFIPALIIVAIILIPNCNNNTKTASAENINNLYEPHYYLELPAGQVTIVSNNGTTLPAAAQAVINFSADLVDGEENSNKIYTIPIYFCTQTRGNSGLYENYIMYTSPTSTVIALVGVQYLKCPFAINNKTVADTISVTLNYQTLVLQINNCKIVQLFDTEYGSEQYDNGYVNGYDKGYDDGVSATYESEGMFAGAIAFVKGIFQVVGEFLSRKIVGDLTIGLFVIGIPATIMIVELIISFVRKLLGAISSSKSGGDDS